MRLLILYLTLLIFSSCASSPLDEKYAAYKAAAVGDAQKLEAIEVWYGKKKFCETTGVDRYPGKTSSPSHYCETELKMNEQSALKEKR